MSLGTVDALLKSRRLEPVLNLDKNCLFSFIFVTRSPQLPPGVRLRAMRSVLDVHVRLKLPRLPRYAEEGRLSMNLWLFCSFRRDWKS